MFEDPSDQRRFYSAFGLNIRSDFEIPDLIEASEQACVDVIIRLGSISRSVDETVGMQMTCEGALLNVPSVARYLIQSGSSIRVEPEPGAVEKNVRLYLLGSAMGMLLHQRAWLPLHANAVVIDGQAVAFLGHPGAGKSTVAAWFADQGFQLLTDDVCLVTQIEAGTPTALLGLPRMRLWREAMSATGRDPAQFDRSFDDMDKYDVPLAAPLRQAAAPLRAIYLLTKAPSGSSGSITRLMGAEALDVVVSNTYRGSYVDLLDGMQSFFQQCINLVRQVPVFEAQREWGYEVFAEQARMLERHASSLVGDPVI